MMHNVGDNLTILNVEYTKPRRDDNGKLEKDFLIMTYKDIDKGIKEHKIIYEPKYTFYVAKKGTEKPYNQFFVSKDSVEAVTVPYNSLVLEIAKRTGHVEDFYDNCRNRNGGANKLMHTDPRIFLSDLSIESFYRMEFNKIYQNQPCPIDRGYIDIEVDTRYINGAFPQPGECPVNAISLILEKTNTEYVFILKDPANPKSYEFEKYIQENDFETEFKKFTEENVGGWKNIHRLNLKGLKIKVIFYEDELEMIRSVFRLINTVQPDFMLAWNMAFDIPYLIERIKILGGSPADIICHPDFEEKYVYYFVDHMHNLPEQKGDYMQVASYSVYLDQMIQFASRRKGQSAYANNKLDYIGEVVAGVRKLDYHDIVENLSDLPYEDFKTFIMYNMTDVIVQKCIEEKTGDISYVFNKALMNSTTYAKVHRQTVYLHNRAAMFFWDKGFVMGNNVNKFNDLSETEKKERTYPGAYVAPPMLVGDIPLVKLGREGIESAINVARNCNDFDYKALYPSLMREHNIAPNTQIGMLYIPNKIWDGENPFRKPEGIYKDQFNRSETFIENFASHNYIEFGHRWFGLATYEEMLEDIYEYFNTVEHPYIPIQRYLSKGKFVVVRRDFDNEKLKVVRREEGKRQVITRYLPFGDEQSTILHNAMEGIILR